MTIPKKTSNRFLVPLAVILVLLESACVSAYKTKQDITLLSQPSGALVKDNGLPIAKTPAVVQLSKKNAHILRFEKQGYAPVEVPVERKADALYIVQVAAAAALASSAQLINHGATRGPVIAAEIGFIVGTAAGMAWGFLGGPAYKLSPSTISVDFCQHRKDAISPSNSEKTEKDNIKKAAREK